MNGLAEPTIGKGTLFYSKREKEVLLWLKYKGMRLGIEELIFLFEKKLLLRRSV